MMNSDLKKERTKATFSVEKLTNVIDGGKHRTSRRRHLEAIIKNDPTGVFSNTNNAYLHRTDRHVRSLAKHVRLIELCRKLGIGKDYDGDILQDKDFFLLLRALGDDLPTSLHWIMFVPNIVCLWDDKQKEEWMPLIRDFRMIGCYAQTELGHGSNIRALETTATFLPESKGGSPGGSFVINSPTLTSSKFWPGTLGRTANHAVVIARLIDGEGVDRGIHNFLVQLRSMKDHKLLPGVKTGDIGPKIGFNVMDNGFAQFKNVIIPRRNMAMRFAQVDEQGKYSKKRVSDGMSKIAYITMMQVRSFIVNDASRCLAMACTITIRYSAVRRQGFAEEGGDEKELQILDYRQQQRRLFSLLAASYCFFFVGKKLQNRLDAVQKRIVANMSVGKAELTDIHASSSALKAYTSTVAADGIEDCRKACGGHGFLQCSGLPELVTTYLQNPTVEGDNQMLPQHVIKVLLKLVETVVRHGNVKEYENCDSAGIISSIQSVLGAEQAEKCKASCEQDMSSLPVLLDAFRHRAARLLVTVSKQLQKSVASGRSGQEAWNDALLEMARASRAYAQFLLIESFIEGITAEEKNNSLGQHEVTVLQNLAQLCSLCWIEAEVGDFLEDGYFTAVQASWVRGNVLKFLDIVRPNAVALVDARDFSDFCLRSALGRYDGDVYPAIIDAALRDPLNQSEPGPGYESHLKRLIVDGVGVYTGTSSRL